jgi:hypothetical protein
VPLSFPSRTLCEFAITSRRDPQKPNEGAPHYVDVAESDNRGHLLEALFRVFELTTRRHHAHLKYVLRWRRTHLSSEYALEVPDTHRHPIG